MELLIVLLMLMVSLNFVLKLTHHSPIGMAVTALVAALWVGLSCDIATRQSRTQIADWLADTDLMLNMAVLLTVDVALHMGLYILLAQRQYGAPMKRATRVVCAVLNWLPGLLIFPTLLSALVQLIFMLPGVDFATVAWSLAAAVFILTLGLGLLFRWVLPEAELRLEVGFLLSALIAGLGVVATVNGRTAVSGTSQVDFAALGGVIALLLAGTVTGYLNYRRKLSRRAKANQSTK